MASDNDFSHVGYIIKRERTSKNIKQVSLVRGICSVSYLSKLENNMIIPNKEIVFLLLNRLNLNIEDIDKNEEVDFLSNILSIYKEGILRRDITQIKKSLKSLDLNFNFIDIKNFYTYQLLMFRLKLIVYPYDGNIENSIQLLKSIETKLNTKQTFIFKMNMGLYHYQSGRNSDAISIFESLLQLTEKADLSGWEKADYYNMLSISYLKSRDHHNAIRYSSYAIKYFKDNLLFNRTIDCYIIKSIAQRNLMEYEKARDNLEKAQKLANSINSLGYEGIIQHNIGSLYAIQEKHDIAIEHFKNSYVFKLNNKQYNDLLSTILCIIKEYTKMDLPSHVVEWCNIGTEILKKCDGKQHIYESYQNHFNIYRARFSQNLDLEKQLKSAIKYFEKINDMRYVQKYSIMLGDYYFITKKYKDASISYQKYNSVSIKQKYINSVEDL